MDNNVTHFPNRKSLPERTAKEIAGLSKMMSSLASTVVTEGKRLPTSLEEAEVTQVIEASKTYSIRAVDVLRIGNNSIPPEFTANREEMYEDACDFLEFFQAYISGIDEIGFTQKDQELIEMYDTFSAWLIKNEARIMQDTELYRAFISFERDVFPEVGKKLLFKLGIEDDIGESDMWERISYELYLRSKKRAV